MRKKEIRPVKWVVSTDIVFALEEENILIDITYTPTEGMLVLDYLLDMTEFGEAVELLWA